MKVMKTEPKAIGSGKKIGRSEGRRSLDRKIYIQNLLNYMVSEITNVVP